MTSFRECLDNPEQLLHNSNQLNNRAEGLIVNNQWKPINELPEYLKETRRMFVVKAIGVAPMKAVPDYPVAVYFESIGESVFYTENGEYNISANRTLFFSEPKIEAATEPVFEPKLVGKVVAV